MIKTTERHRGFVPPRLALRDLGRVSFMLAGIAVFIAALAAPVLRRPDGSLPMEGWILAISGASLVIIGAASRTRWQRASLLLGLALIGQATALGLIDAPNFNVLQHYYPWGEILTSHRALLLLGPLAQTLIAAYAVWRYGSQALASIRRLLSPFQALVFLGIVLFGIANGSFDLARYAGEVALATWVIVVNAINLVLAAATMPQQSLESLTKWLRSRFEAGSAGDRALPWAVALWVIAASATLAWTVFDSIPHIPDSVSYLFQAKYMSAGHIYLPAPPDAAAFDFEKFYSNGTKMWAYGFPGWPAILAIGVLAKAAWLVNPVLAGLTVLLAHAVVSRMYSRSLAHIAVLLLAASPWFLFMSASFMAHPLTLVLALMAIMAVVKAQKSSPILLGLAAGAALGGLFLTRPAEGVLVSAAIGLWVILKGTRDWGLGIGGKIPNPQSLVPSPQLLAGVAVGAVLVGGLLFPYNQALTGNPLLTPHQLMTDTRLYPGADRVGFGSEVGTYGWRHLDPLPGHGPVDVVLNAHMNLYMANFELFGWAFGSLGFVVLLLLWRRATRQDWLFLLIMGLTVAGHSLFWFSGGPDFGARYWYQLLIPLVILTARGIQEAQRRWVETGGTRAGALRVGAFVVAASLVAMVAFMPWRSLEKYRDYRGMNADMATLSQEYGFDNAIIFVQEQDPADYARALILNPPILESSGTIYARDLGPDSRAAVMQHFKGRPAWIVRSTAPGQPFEVVEGPIENKGMGNRE